MPTEPIEETLSSVTSALKLSAEFFNIFRAKRISAKAERVPERGGGEIDKAQRY